MNCDKLILENRQCKNASSKKNCLPCLWFFTGLFGRVWLTAFESFFATASICINFIISYIWKFTIFAEIKSISQSFKHVTEEDKEGGQKANESDIILSENKMNDSVTVRCVTFLLILNSLNSCISFSLILYYWN